MVTVIKFKKEVIVSDSIKLKWRRGVPDEPGFWGIWPDEGHWLNGSTEPRVRLVKKSWTPGGEDLFIHKYPDHEHKSEACLFKGRVAGPIIIEE